MRRKSNRFQLWIQENGKWVENPILKYYIMGSESARSVIAKAKMLFKFHKSEAIKKGIAGIVISHPFFSYNKDGVSYNKILIDFQAPDIEEALSFIEE